MSHSECCLVVYLEARFADSQVIEFYLKCTEARRADVNTDYESFQREVTEEKAACFRLSYANKFSFFDLVLSVSAQVTQLDKVILQKKKTLLTCSSENCTLRYW